jgi:hypothetical protein
MPAPTPPRPTPTRLGRIGLVLLALCAAPAQAGPGDPVANASEIPALASLLQRTGWAATPELTGNIRIGDVYASTQQGQQWQAEGCLAAKARVSPYTQVELSTQLQMGVSVKMGVAKVEGSGSLTKKMRFGAPEHHALPGMGMVLTADCLSQMEALVANQRDLSGWYVVKEVLMAEIAEQSCGEVDAEGRFVAFGAANAELAQACSQSSPGPVAVAWRTVPLSELAPSLSIRAREEVVPAPTPQASTIPVDAVVASMQPPTVESRPLPGPAGGSAHSLRTDGFYDCEVPILGGLSVQPISLVIFDDGRVNLGVALTARGLSRNYPMLRNNPSRANARLAVGARGIELRDPGADIVITAHDAAGATVDLTWLGMNKVNGAGARGLFCPFVPM